MCIIFCTKKLMRHDYVFKNKGNIIICITHRTEQRKKKEEVVEIKREKQ